MFSLIVALATGCAKKKDTQTAQTGGGDQPQPQPVLTSIRVTPTSVVLPKGKTQQFSAYAIDQNGNVMSGIALAWMSGNENVFVDSTGKATAQKDPYDVYKVNTDFDVRAEIYAYTGTIYSNAATVTCVVNVEGTWRIVLTGDTKSDTVRTLTQDGRTVYGSGLGVLTIQGGGRINSDDGTFYFGRVGLDKITMSGSYEGGSWGSGKWTAAKQ